MERRRESRYKTFGIRPPVVKSVATRIKKAKRRLSQTEASETDFTSSPSYNSNQLNYSYQSKYGQQFAESLNDRSNYRNKHGSHLIERFRKMYKPSSKSVVARIKKRYSLSSSPSTLISDLENGGDSEEIENIPLLNIEDSSSLKEYTPESETTFIQSINSFDFASPTTKFEKNLTETSKYTGSSEESRYYYAVKVKFTNLVCFRFRNFK